MKKNIKDHFPHLQFALFLHWFGPNIIKGQVKSIAHIIKCPFKWVSYTDSKIVLMDWAWLRTKADNAFASPWDRRDKWVCPLKTYFESIREVYKHKTHAAWLSRFTEGWLKNDCHVSAGDCIPDPGLFRPFLLWLGGSLPDIISNLPHFGLSSEKNENCKVCTSSQATLLSTTDIKQEFQ